MGRTPSTVVEDLEKGGITLPFDADDDGEEEVVPLSRTVEADDAAQSARSGTSTGTATGHVRRQEPEYVGESAKLAESGFGEVTTTANVTHISRGKAVKEAPRRISAPRGSAKTAPSLSSDTERSVARSMVRHVIAWSEKSTQKSVGADHQSPVDLELENVSVFVRPTQSVFSKLNGYSKMLLGRAANEIRELELVKNVTARIAAGEVTAIMGASGAGKTTLLNALAQRSSTARVQGDLLLNGKPLTPAALAGCSAYVKQEDILMPFLTVRETLDMNASLRMRAARRLERGMVVEEILVQLGLTECADSMIGDSLSRGISGSERRRVSVAIQLLAMPQLLFLDEPTSSLDSYSALTLVELLTELAHKHGKTVVMSVHQPRASAFEQFDNVILLCRGGHLVYSGKQNSILPYFSSIGFPCPDGVNPADFILDISSVDSTTPAADTRSRERLAQLVTAWKSYTLKGSDVSRDSTANADTIAAEYRDTPKDAESSSTGASGSTLGSDVSDGAEESGYEYSEAPTSIERPSGGMQRFYGETTTLALRGLKNLLRDQQMIFGVILFQTLLLAVIRGYIFWQLPGNLTGLRSRLTLAHTSVFIQPDLMGVLFAYMLAKDVSLYDSDRAEHVHGLLSWLLTQFVVYTPYTVIGPAMYSAIVYSMAGLRPGLFYFLDFAIPHVLSVINIWSLALASVAFTHSYYSAALLTTTFSALPAFAGGFIIQTSTLPRFLIWAKYVSPAFWGFQLSVISEFKDRMFSCPYMGTPLESTLCSAYSGNTQILQLGFSPDYSFATRYLALVVLFAVRMLLAAALFKLIKVSPLAAGGGDTGSDAPPAFKEISLDDEDRLPTSDFVVLELGDKGLSRQKSFRRRSKILSRFDRVDVSIIDASLLLVKKPLFGNKPPNLKFLLNKVSATFKAGTLTAILGPGSSGKTTLLNFIMMNSPANTATDLYIREGTMEHNEKANPSPNELMSTASFVRKDSNAIYPFLTVRETLRYAAQLRLWKFSRAKREERVTDIIQVLGLADSANTQVGNSHIKGISGGERRRLLIGLGLIQDPRVLIIDDATTGLDSCAARIVVETLKDIASSGRTVIISGQQTRPEIFAMLDQVILLVEGGRVAYKGTTKGMVEFMGAVGYPCPRTSNPADHAVDVTSVDRRDVIGERASRARVDSIVAKFVHLEGRDSDDAGLSGLEMRLASMSQARNSFIEVGVDLAGSIVTGGNRHRPYSAPLWVSVGTLLHRGIKIWQRSPGEFFSRILLPFLYGGVLAMYYSDGLAMDFYSIQNRQGLLFQIPALFFNSLVSSVATYPLHRAVFHREYLSGLYEGFPFFFVHLVLELFPQAVGAGVFTLLAGVRPGLQMGGNRWMVFWAVGWAFLNCGESVALFILSLVEHVGLGMSVVSTINSILIVMCGVGATTLPPILESLNLVSPLRWATYALATQEFTNLSLTCSKTPEQAFPDGTCIFPTGKSVLEQQLNIFDVDVMRNLWIVLALTVAARVLAYLALQYKLWRLQ